MNNAKKIILCCGLAATLSACHNMSDDNLAPQERLMTNEARIDSIIAGMSLDEKIAMLHSKTIMSSEGIPRLGILPIQYTDGPFAIREEHDDHFQSLNLSTDSATYFPTGSALAATWSEDLAYQYGAAMGREARARGKDIVLGPAMNIQRLPVCGRTYEYFSEDPLMTGILATAYVRGMQGAGTAACLKHYALNNQETNRSSVNVIIDERSMRELYLRPFEMAVREGGAMCVMPSYNKINGVFGAENDLLNNKILRDEWGFRGMTVSDWGGTHSTVASALGGLDVQMPGDNYFGQALKDSVEAGLVPDSIIDAKVRHILRLRFAIEAVPADKANTTPASTDENRKVAYDVATKSIVLLKNEQNALPLQLDSVKKIAVIGLNAELSTAAGGIGAGAKTPYEITPLQGLRHRVGSQAEIVYAPCYRNYFGMFGNRYPGVEGTTDINAAPDPARLQEAISAARDADVVLFFAGTNKCIESEGFDRDNIMLPVCQDKIIPLLAQANPNIITVVVSAGPTDLNVVNQHSRAIVQAWWNGLEGGHALADILLGTISPSGKLPFTFPRTLEESPAYAMGNFPQKDGVGADLFTSKFRKDVDIAPGRLSGDAPSPEAHYTEGLLVGYRWFDTKQLPVMYPFGYGLSYTTFQYRALAPSAQSYPKDGTVKATFTLENTGSMAADEVVQLYARYIGSSTERPYKELKAFKRVSLKAGEQQKVTLEFPVEELKYWDVTTHGWQIESGKVELLLGASSADIRQKAEIEIQ